MPRHLRAIHQMIDREDIGGAWALARAAATRATASPPTLLVAGRLALRLGHTSDAVRFAEATLSAATSAHPPGDPLTRAGAYDLLGGCWSAKGDHTRALSAFQDALRAAPTDSAIRHNLANAALHAGEHALAVRTYTALLHQQPNDWDSVVNLGVALSLMGRHPEAAGWFERATRESPTRADAWLNLGTTLAKLGARQAPLDCFETAARLQPNAAPPHTRLGWFLAGRGDAVGAKLAFSDALRRDPTHLPAIAGVAHLAERRGDIDAGIALLQPHADQLTGTIRGAVTYATLLQREGNPQRALTLIDDAITQMGPTAESAHLHFKRAELLDELRHHEDAFTTATRANKALGRARAVQSPVDRVRALRATFTAEMFAAAPPGIAHPAPIFIVGLPRSGTSLIEQMLCAHPSVHGAGELEELHTMAGVLSRLTNSDRPWPACIRELSPLLTRQLAATHLAHLASVGGGAPHVTDKMPENTWYLGLAAVLLPAARVVVMERDPMDVARSCYFHHFAQGSFSYSLDLNALGQTIAAHEAIIAHWRSTLPLQMHTVRYRDLVQQPEPTMRALLAFLGLDWSPAAMRPDKNTRAVRTASYAQVREPLHRRALARSAPYLHHLAPVRDAMRATRDILARSEPHI